MAKPMSLDASVLQFAAELRPSEADPDLLQSLFNVAFAGGDDVPPGGGDHAGEGSPKPEATAPGNANRRSRVSRAAVELLQCLITKCHAGDRRFLAAVVSAYSASALRHASNVLRDDSFMDDSFRQLATTLGDACTQTACMDALLAVVSEAPGSGADSAARRRSSGNNNSTDDNATRYYYNGSNAFSEGGAAGMAAPTGSSGAASGRTPGRDSRGGQWQLAPPRDLCRRYFCSRPTILRFAVAKALLEAAGRTGGAATTTAAPPFAVATWAQARLTGKAPAAWELLGLACVPQPLFEAIASGGASLGAAQPAGGIWAAQEIWSVGAAEAALLAQLAAAVEADAGAWRRLPPTLLATLCKLSPAGEQLLQAVVLSLIWLSQGHASSGGAGCASSLPASASLFLDECAAASAKTSDGATNVDPAVAELVAALTATGVDIWRLVTQRLMT